MSRKPKAAPPAATPDPKGDSGWYINDQGEWCYEGRCIKLTGNPATGEMVTEFDPHCDIEAVSQAERTAMKNVLEHKGMLFTWKAPDAKNHE